MTSSAPTFAIRSRQRVGSGTLCRISHPSSSTGTSMTFGLYLPSRFASNLDGAGATKKEDVPALYWLSGLTCDDTNFAQKAGPKAFGAAEAEGIAIVMPDTSPRGEGVPNDDGYDLGIGAGFYVDATEAPWSKNFRMYTYVTKELPALLEANFSVGTGGLRSVTGHSMGGHGALSIALKDPKGWVSVSAFSPICNPTQCPWGDKAFKAYLGGGEAGKAHDATALLAGMTGPAAFDDILIDQGKDDEFLTQLQLLPENLVAAAEKCGQKLTLNMRDGFDHSYYFIASFIEDHVVFHGRRLRSRQAKLLASASDIYGTVVPTAGKPIECEAMVARGPKQPLSRETITVDPPKAGEVRVKVIANALCHTDIYTLDGHDPEG
ncbi:hypothetical protein ACHAWF_008579 [Thalassiosira exigua]